LKNEKELIKKAIRVGMHYGENRGKVKFKATDSVNDKMEYRYCLLVHDQMVAPLAPDQVSMLTMKHKASTVGFKT
jgi:hypothetical protein